MSEDRTRGPGIVRLAVVLTLLVAVAGKAAGMATGTDVAVLDGAESWWRPSSSVALALELVAALLLTTGRLVIGGVLTVFLASGFALATGWRELAGTRGGCGCLGAIDLDTGSHVALILGLGLGGLLLVRRGFAAAD